MSLILSDDEEWSWNPNERPGWMLADDSSDEETTATDEGLTGGGGDGEPSSSAKSKGGDEDTLDSDDDDSESDSEEIADKTESIKFLSSLLDQASPAKDHVVTPSAGLPSSTPCKGTRSSNKSSSQDGSQELLPAGKSATEKGMTKNMPPEAKKADHIVRGSAAGVRFSAPDLENILLGRRVSRRGRRGVVIMKPMISSSDEAVYYIRWEDDDTMEQVDCVDDIRSILCEGFDPNYADPAVAARIGDALLKPSTQAKRHKRKGAPHPDSSSPAAARKSKRKRRKTGAAEASTLQTQVPKGCKKLGTGLKAAGKRAKDHEQTFSKEKPKKKKREKKKPKEKKCEKNKKGNEAEKENPRSQANTRVLPKKNWKDDVHYMEGAKGRWYDKKLCLTPGDLTVEQYFHMDFDSDAEWNVERIVDERVHRKTKQFLVKYTGYELNPGTRYEQGDWLSFKEANELKAMDDWLAAKEQYDVI